MSTVLADQHGVPMSGSAEAVALYDHAIDRLLRFHPDVVSDAETLTSAHADVPMGHALTAYLYLMSTDARDLEVVATAAANLRALALHPRERFHSAAIDAWLAGDWSGASRILDDLLQAWPADLLALALGQQLDFFLGDAGNLRDRVGRSLPNLDPLHPHVGFVHGMQSFGYEEAGHYALAEDAGLTALDTNRDDVWAIHAVVHTYEMQGRIDDGLRFLLTRESDWGSGSLFTVHNWWHLALYALEAGDRARALTIYDEQIHNDSSAGVPIEMLDASGLLWRFVLDGADTGAGAGTGDRFTALADAWIPSATVSPWYAFNDLHAVMAFVGAGRFDDALAVVSRLESYVVTANGTNVQMTAEIGLPACRAIIAFGEGRHHDVISALAPIRRVFQHFGGSHAQRDALQRTLLESALRAGELDLARALTAERLNVRGRANYNWAKRAEALRALGDQAAATAAATEAEQHRQRYAAALT